MDDKTIKCVLVVVCVVLVGYLLMNYLNQDYITEEQVEGFYNEDTEPTEPTEPMETAQGVQPSEALDEIAEPGSIDQSESSQSNQTHPECYPKDVLTSAAELLPQDSNSRWAQAVPSGTGSLQDKNFLNAGFHVGINTVGQTLRNANRQLRSEFPNPQVKVSPWMQTTIDPDINRKPMEIGS